MLFGAPDLSFTQFMVETLSVVIIALVLTRLQLMKQDRRSTLALLFDGSVAIAVGVGMGALLMNITQAPLDLRLSEFFSTYSASIAHGRNIVNVILVDFRAIDTLGEITVVLITGVAALALIRVKAAPGPKKKTARADAVSAKEAA
jgi:multicomponent Na+:H+ antiporter subunit A